MRKMTTFLPPFGTFLWLSFQIVNQNASLRIISSIVCKLHLDIDKRILHCKKHDKSGYIHTCKSVDSLSLIPVIKICVEQHPTSYRVNITTDNFLLQLKMLHTSAHLLVLYVVYFNLQTTDFTSRQMM